MKKRFFLLTRHTDSEITDFIQKNAENGFALKKVEGNNFYFEPKQYDGFRLCALTLYSHGHSVSTEMQVREELPYLRKKGWDMVCIGKQETLSDSRRHVFLKEEIKGSIIPKQDAKCEKQALLRGRFKAFSNLLLCIIYISAVVFLLSTTLIKVVTSNAYICLTLLFSLSLLFCTTLCLMSVFKRKYINVATRLTSFLLIFFAIFLLFDTWFTEKNSTENVKIGASSYKLYHDNIPFTLDDAGVNTGSFYRTTIKTGSSSFIASYYSCFDECFGVKAGENVYDEAQKGNVMFISYTVFESKSEKLNNVISSQLVPGTLVYSEEKTKFLGCDGVFVCGKNTIILSGDRILYLKSGIDIQNSYLKSMYKTLLC